MHRLENKGELLAKAGGMLKRSDTAVHAADWQDLRC